MNHRRSLLDWLFGAALSVLLIAVMLSIAVDLLSRIWPTLAVIAGVGLLAFAAVGGLRWWRERW